MSDTKKEYFWLNKDDDFFDDLGNGMLVINSNSSSKCNEFFNVVRFDNLPVLSKSCGNLVSEVKKRKTIFRSLGCLSLDTTPKYQIPAKVPHYWNTFSDSQLMKPRQLNNSSDASKEEYLEEINSRLMRELEEKNATLLQLQENYEHLLLKYAEAQNKIDNLRFQSSSNDSNISARKKYKPKLQVKNILKPPVYSYKSSNNKTPVQLLEEKSKVDRPSTLPVDILPRSSHRDALKAVTPTDSEGVSSVITSMSGHSKILTNFDEKDEEKNKKTVLKSDVLEKSLPVNDPFDKVKLWQNSLPPLELIERPDTGLYDSDPTEITSLSTRYHELPVCELENIPETPEWQGQQSKEVSQVSMKRYLRTLSLPSSLTRRNILSQIYKRRNNHSIDVSSPVCHESPPPPPEDGLIKKAGSRSATPPPPSIHDPSVFPDPNIIRRRKRPPFLRSSSLPMYHYDTPRSVLHCDIPPLDLENLNLSDDETSPINNSNVASNSSFFSSHECSFQTLNSLNSCKAAVGDLTPTLNSQNESLVMIGSTSITPDRSNQHFQDDRDCELDSCNVCGEMMLSVKAASFHGIPKKPSENDFSLPISRSFSFNTESSSPTLGLNSTSREPFEVFANNLKTRSQITMKALTAHVNNS